MQATTLSEDMPMNDPSPETDPHTAAAASAPAKGRTDWSAPRQRFDPRVKSPGFAAFLSIAPGLGQVYIGYYTRGAVLAAVTFTLFIATEAVGGSAEPLFVFAGLFAWAFGIIDAGRLAALYNHAMEGSGAFELPGDFAMPRMGGSIGGGALLVLLGVVALSNTAFGLSLYWLESWWPLLPIAIGAYLLYGGVQERQG